MRSLISAVIDNFKCLSAHICDDLNKKDTIVFVYFIDACETLRKKLSKFMKIAKKFNEELKLANLEKEELIVRLDESNKKNEFLRNQFSSQNEKMKSLEQKLAEVEAKLEICLIPNLLLIIDLFLFLFLLSLITKFMFLLSRGIIKKILILLG